MQKIKSKKGFTLAELLIVVAIIAVLVAIAVPLFVGALNKATKATEDANVRSLRSYALAYILTVDETTDATNYEKIYKKGTREFVDNADKNGFFVTATLNGDGEFTITDIEVATSKSEKDEKYDKTAKTVTCIVKPSSVNISAGE